MPKASRTGMTVQVERCLYRLKECPGGPTAWADDPWLRDDESPLTKQERAAILSVDVERLWAMGVHPLLLLQFTRAAGVPVPEYYKRIRRTGIASSLRS